MRISEAKFSRRYNVGNYEHEELSLTAVVEEGESAVDVLTQLKADIEAAHTGGEATSVIEPGKVKKSKKKVEEADEEQEQEESEEETTGGTEESDDESEEETDDEAEEEETAKSSKKSSIKGKKAFKKKPQVYQRSNETHKEIFSGVLKVVAPKWKATAESKTAAKMVSQKMEGKPFLDESGEVLEDFKATVKRLMAGKK